MKIQFAHKHTVVKIERYIVQFRLKIFVLLLYNQNRSYILQSKRTKILQQDVASSAGCSAFWHKMCGIFYQKVSKGINVDTNGALFVIFGRTSSEIRPFKE